MALKLNIDSLDELDGLIPHIQGMNGQPPASLSELPTIPSAPKHPTTIHPLSPTTEANLASGTHLQPGVGSELFKRGLPAVSAQPFTPENYQQKQERADYEKMHPWGSPVSEHPGTWGKIAHGAAKVGNIAGDILAPGVMANIPGTDLNKQREEIRNLAGLTAAEKNKETEALTEKAKADVPLEEAQAWKALHPTPTSGIEAVALGQPEVARQWVNMEEQAKAAGVGKTPAEQTYADLLKQGKTPEEALAAVTKPPQDNATKEDERYEGIESAQRLGKPVTPEDAAWAKAYEKRKTLAPFASAVAQAPQKGTERLDRSYQYNSSALDKASTPIEQMNQRLGRLSDTLAQHNPQADALVAPELLSVMAGGPGSGVRMNEAEIARIVGGRSAWETLRAAMQHWSTDPDAARSITPDQDRQIRALVGAVKQKLDAKMRVIDEAHEKLLDAEDPKDHREAVIDAKKKMDAIDAGSAEPPRPANVPGNYVFQENGPKGRGWYKPTK